MANSRQKILASLRAGTRDEGFAPKHVLPDFNTAEDNLASRLKQKLEAVHSSVDLVSSAAMAGQSIIDFLQRNNAELSVGVPPAMEAAEYAMHQELAFYSCEDYAACKTVLVQAPYAIAETGTVLLPSSVERPTLANFLPDNCIVLLNETDIVPYLEQGLSIIRNSDAGMPRALNMISGPSKTADIEQTLVYGAHGPIQLHVIIRQR